MKRAASIKRKTIDYIYKTAATFFAAVAIFVLAVIIFEVLKRGAGAINFSFFFHLPKPPGEEGGGIVNALFGSFVITMIASLIGIPLGIMSAIYSTEFGRGTLFSRYLRFSTEILSSVPSIIIGLFVYAVFVVPMKSFSTIAGAIALSIITIPLIHRVTEEMLLMVPDTLREAGLALGVTYPVVVRKICLKSAKIGVITGILAAIARISGETAPLLFTSLNSPFWNFSLFKPMATANVTVFVYAMSPYDDWRQIAWGASFLITVSILLLTIMSRILFKRVKNG
jgi:phosphate transport system permease protein